MTDSGVYIITAISGKQYVGSAINFASRWRVHKHHLRNGTHPNAKLQAAWNKHGAVSFKFERLLICDREDVLFYEQRAINVLKPWYNILQIAGHSTGYKHTPETRAGFSAARKGVSHGPRSEETKEKIRAKQIGVKRGSASLETKEKLCIASTAAMTPEARQHLSKINSGKTLTDEHSAKISAAHRLSGHSFPRSATERAANNRRGKKQSEETKAKRLASYLRTVAKRNAASGL